ncbi:hypothetical protein [Streptomyces sp. NPDC093149]|uniref:hypothetical protein n=1 Tax=Streptomyces sp. NPDC093149 TaxID=3366031 RepID=UPI00382A9E9C
MTEMVPLPLGASPPRGPGATFRYTFTGAGAGAGAGADACFCSIRPVVTATVGVTP